MFSCSPSINSETDRNITNDKSAVVEENNSDYFIDSQELNRNVTSTTIDIRSKVVYFAMIDRFKDGYSGNNYVNGNDPDAARHWPNTAEYGYPGNNIGQLSYNYKANGKPTNPDNWKKFWGGDLQGLTQSVPYLSDLGVGCIYITCPVKQSETQAYYSEPNDPARSHPYTAFHGYWMKDLFRIDEHFAGPKRYDQTDAGEAGGSEGWAVFDKFVAECRNANPSIDIMIDIPINHSNPVNLGYGFQDIRKYRDNNRNEYTVDYGWKNAGFAGWGENGAVYKDKEFKGSFGEYFVNGTKFSNSDSNWFYHHFSSGNDTVNQTGFPGYGFSGLADFNHTLKDSFANAWADPTKEPDNPIPYNYLRDGLKKMIDHGVYNFRIDATKHSELPFLRKITKELYDYAKQVYGKDLYFVGEWAGSGFPAYDGQNGYGGGFGYDVDFNGKRQHYATFYDYYKADPTANFDFQLSYRLQESVRGRDDDGNARDFRNLCAYMTGRENWFNTVNNEQDKHKNDYQMNMLNNQDQPRFMQQIRYYGNSQKDEATARKIMDTYLAILLTSRGIPMLYYGDEIYLYHDNPSKDKDSDPYNRPMMPDNFQNLYISQSEIYGKIHSAIKKLSYLRRTNPAISSGSWKERWKSENIFVYERVNGDKKVLVCVNKDSGSFTFNSDSGLFTELASGNYYDYLRGDIHGDPNRTMSVSLINGKNQVTSLTLNPYEAAVFTTDNYIDSSKCYKIVNKATGNVLTLRKTNDFRYHDIVSSDWNNLNTQKWLINGLPELIRDGSYKGHIRSKSTGEYLSSIGIIQRATYELQLNTKLGSIINERSIIKMSGSPTNWEISFPNSTNYYRTISFVDSPKTISQVDPNPKLPFSVNQTFVRMDNIYIDNFTGIDLQQWAFIQVDP